ncbi:MAG: amylo-alpha-1,6-glucosidase [Methanospirillum sp.]|uniref:amylo-alpha-1,6-glucosidase n=1 Tax=Methanospirillum sp. TaxID=45200 RepID=UPI00236AB770|nr:amylo-alpha-1,6-glucosidase [Methanospirillum sp.]MDD1729901.1 amylo-alpha-1,6-glucosidase [Methanospirillum sp.]
MKLSAVHAEDLTSIPNLIRYGRELRDPDIAGSREFLMVDGEMYCSSSFAGNTRRYHGLLIHKREVLLSALHDEANGIRLSSGWWGETFVGEGLALTLGATIYPVVQEFAIPGARIRRSFILHDGLTIRYEITGTISMMIRPLMTRRSVKDLSHEPLVETNADAGELILNGCRVSASLPFSHDLQRYHNARYPREQERGYDAREDLVSPGYFSGPCTDGVIEIRFVPQNFMSQATTIQKDSRDILDHAARICVSNNQIHAGYHWFTEPWGRDTFISLPGLLLENGRFREAEDLFRWHLANRKGGLLVNRYPDSFHAADTTLWFFWALFQYVQKLPGSPFVSTIRHEIEDLITAYPGSGIASLNGNLIQVEAGSTWMDTSYTPRTGLPVEINALWILALELLEYLKIPTPVRSTDARKEFEAFWNPDTGCLYDLLGPDDATIRSNQIIALALGLVPFDDGNRALQVIERELLTPYGIRTLSPASPGYSGRYTGDASYHNGMVWPWQIGFYLDALIQYGADQKKIESVISPLWHYFLTDGSGLLPEMFDGDAPYQPAGTICQAWSIAELIRARSTLLTRKDRTPPEPEVDDNYLFA